MLYLVTGGAGFLGGWLARELLNLGHDVRVLDVARTNLVPMKADFIEADIRNREAVRSACIDVDVVFHLAFVQSMSQKPMAEREGINIGGMRIVLEESFAAGVGRFVHTSTIEIYGTHPPCPCPEISPKDPVGWYGQHKMECERILWQFAADSGLAVTALRMPNICGPGYYNHRGTLGLMDRILDDRLMITIDHGDTLADMVHYQDVIHGYLLAARKHEAVGQAFNISCRKPSSHRQIMKAMKRAVHSRTQFFRIPRRIARPALWGIDKLRIVEVPDYQQDYLLNDNVYSVEKARRLLGYEPKMSAAEASAELIKFYATDREQIRLHSRSY